MVKDDRRPPSHRPVAERRDADRAAVALRYAPVDSRSAPKVVASGRGWLAEKIIEVAEAHGVSIRHDADLAEVLSAIEVGREIPVEAFVTVAEILRYVYGTTPPEFKEP